MTEDNTQNDQPTEEQQPSDETQPKLREISEEELKKILEDHKKWLESDGKEGKKANLVGAKLHKSNFFETNLQWANLHKAALYKANFINANLHLANLIECNLQKAVLWGSNLEITDFRRADLYKANFNDTNLQQANFHKANLQKSYFIGAKLHNADLSKADMRNTVLDGVKGLNEAKLKHANLEKATGLLGNEFAQANVTGTKLPEDIKEFKALETVEKTSQNARKIFFAMLLGCVYSWLTIATTTDVRLLTNSSSSPLPIIGTEIPIAWFYIAAPLVLICLYFYFHLYLDNLWGALAGLPAIFPDGKRLDERAYPWLLNTLVRRHFKRLKNRPLIARMKEWITIFLAWCVVPFTMIAFWLRYIPRHDWVGTCFHIGLIVVSIAFAVIFYRLCALTLQGKKKVEFRLKKFWGDRRFYYGVSVVVVGVLFSLLSFGAIEGDRPPDPMPISWQSLFPMEIIPTAFNKMGYDVFADFNEKSVSEKPTNYWEIRKEDRLESVKGANLSKRNLKNANMVETFLVKADLRYALLNKAVLDYANLESAILGHAVLNNTTLQSINMKKTYLDRTNLQESEIRMVNLQEAYFVGVNLKKAKFYSTNLKNSTIRHSNLQEANFSKANLQNAIIIFSDLRGAKYLTIEQLSKVKSLYETKLDPDLMEQIKKCCPHLLEYPEERTDITN